MFIAEGKSGTLENPYTLRYQVSKLYVKTFHAILIAWYNLYKLLWVPGWRFQYIEPHSVCNVIKVKFYVWNTSASILSLYLLPPFLKHGYIKEQTWVIEAVLCVHALIYVHCLYFFIVFSYFNTLVCLLSIS